MSARARFRSRPGATLGLLLLGLLALLSLGADLVASDLPLAARLDGRWFVLPCLVRPPALAGLDQQALRERGALVVPTLIAHGPRGDLAPAPAHGPPSLSHPLGTDGAGRDVAARLLHGTRTALVVGALATSLFVLAGLLVGAGCALGRGADALLARLIEVGGAVPAYFLLLAVQAAALVRGQGATVVEVAVAIALTRWPEVARVTRAEALRVLASPHVEAARAIGLPPLTIALRHVAPLAAGPALVAGAVGVAQAVLLETGLSFLGFGVPPPTPSWGSLLADAHEAGMPAHLLLPPALAVALLMIACGRVADGLQAVLDPRTAHATSAANRR